MMRFSKRNEISAWILYILIANTVNATSVIMEHARDGEPITVWEPLVWEYTSGIITLILIPLILTLDRRIPFRVDSWKRSLFIHVFATVPFSLLHTSAMVALRKGLYRLADRHYDFGNVPVELLYEYRKDFLTYFFIIAAIYAYRMFRANHSGADYDADRNDYALPKILVKKHGQVYRVASDNIDWIEAAGNYVILHVGDSSHPLRDTMKGIADRLGSGFCRVHRSSIVNLGRVATVSPVQGGDLQIRLKSQTTVRCSRTMRQHFEQGLAAFKQN